MTSSLIVGASGFLGRHMMKEVGPGAIGTFFRSKFEAGIYFDLASGGMAQLLQHLGPGPKVAYVLGASVNRAHCQNNPVDTYRLNVTSVIRAMASLFDCGFRVVYISSDDVFDGSKKFFTENDFVNPVSEYGRQKVAVEHWLQSTDEDWAIVRLPKLLSSLGEENCLLGNWIGRLASGQEVYCATDEFFCPLDVVDAAQMISSIGVSQFRGICHVCGEKRVSRSELLKMVLHEGSKLEFSEPNEVKWVKLSSILSFPSAAEKSMSNELYRSSFMYAAKPLTKIVGDKIASMKININLG